MSDPDYVYTIYIRATPQAIWDALTDGSSIAHFWAGRTNESSWKKGAPLIFKAPDGAEDFSGEVLESEPPHLLRFTFHLPGPGPMHDEGPSEVTYRIEPSRELSRLTVTHSGFPDGSAVREGVQGGWPRILSGLKSLLETGQGIGMWSRADEGS
jgi:uncharacterized protein YndB with AHSA1/START domain